MSGELILFLAANPSKTDGQALANECAAIERVLRMAPFGSDFKFESKWAVTIDAMMQHLVELKPMVIHFSGRGNQDQESRDSPGIYVRNEDDGMQLLSSTALAKMIKAAAGSARLVVLNACYSATQAEEICSAVDCMVGMTSAVSHKAAHAFAIAFYRALGNRRSVANAVEQAAAVLEAHQLNGELPCCSTRAGIDADHLILTGDNKSLPWDPTWPQRFESIVWLTQHAHDNLDSAPTTAALRARQAIEHIINYLYERTGGSASSTDQLEHKLERVIAKHSMPQMIADQFRFATNNTSSALRTSGLVSDPDPGLLAPCVGALTSVVKWFFRDHLKRAPVLRGGVTPFWLISDTTPDPVVDGTPTSTFGTVLTTRVEIGESIPIWRTQAGPSTLWLDAEHNPLERCTFLIECGRNYLLGRTEFRKDGTQNNFVVPNEWDRISQDQASVTTHAGSVVLTNTSGYDNVFVRHEKVANGASRMLCHQDVVQIGRCVGMFRDGRYYPTAPSSAVDLRTGLLSEQGLISEIGGVLEHEPPRTLFVVRCPDDPNHASDGTYARDRERAAVKVTLAIHRHDPTIPLGRIGVHVVALLGSVDRVRDIADVVAKVIGPTGISGFVTLTDTADHALPRLQACLSALHRIAISGDAQRAPQDLARYALHSTPLAEFPVAVRPLFHTGGGAMVVTMGELDQLEREARRVIAVLERELVEMVGARMGPRDVIWFDGKGWFLFGTPGDVAQFAEEVAVAWHARGPIRTASVEIDRSLSTHLLAISDLDELNERAAALARGSVELGASGLPAPLALAASALHDVQDPLERAAAIVDLVVLTWRLLAFVLVAAARDTAPSTSNDEAAPNAWPAPWRAAAREAARRLGGHLRVTELASTAVLGDRDEPLRAAIELLAETANVLREPAPDRTRALRNLPQLMKAVRDVLAAFRPLRGWTLVAITKSELDTRTNLQYIEYLDFTGPTRKGSPQRIAVSGFKELKRFVYLVRWDEQLAVALEPYVRYVGNEVTGHGELLLAETLISEPGDHRYRSMTDGHEITRHVVLKQLGSRR